MGNLTLKLVMQDDNIKNCKTITSKENKIDKKKREEVRSSFEITCCWRL
jgi:hypothetical protein